EQAQTALADECDSFLRRVAIEASLTAEERLEILRGMILTRATDNRLKALFLGGEVRFGAMAFQGKGFRSLGQEAIYGAAMRLRRGAKYHRAPHSDSRSARASGLPAPVNAASLGQARRSIEDAEAAADPRSAKGL